LVELIPESFCLEVTPAAAGAGCVGWCTQQQQQQHPSKKKKGVHVKSCIPMRKGGRAENNYHAISLSLSSISFFLLLYHPVRPVLWPPDVRVIHPSPVAARRRRDHRGRRRRRPQKTFELPASGFSLARSLAHSLSHRQGRQIQTLG
jgi:hypothetical protein